MNQILRGRGAFEFWTVTQRLYVFGLMVASWAIAAALAWQATDRTAPVTVEQIRILPPVVRPGQTVDIEFTVDRKRTCAVRGEGYIFDGANVRWPYEPTPLKTVSDTIGRETYAIRRAIPVGASPGRAYYRLTLYHVCPMNVFHLIWPITNVAQSLAFEIAPPT